MRLTIFIVAGLVLVMVLVVVIGALLPKAHSVSRTVRIALPPDALYAVIADVGQYQSWRHEVKTLQRLPDKNGMAAWIEETGGMKIPMRFERMERPTVLVARIDTNELPFSGVWTYRIVPAGPGAADLTITEDGEVSNPFFRFMSRFVFGQYGTMDAFLKNLQAKPA
jgi:hypothetical protein